MSGEPTAADHGTAIAVGEDGVLIRGVSGSGKSTLALKLLQLRSDCRLIADDRVRLKAEDGVLLASAPPTTAGLMEVRGLGILRFPFRSAVPVRLVADLLPPTESPRMPEGREQIARIHGVDLPRLVLPIGGDGSESRILVALTLLGPEGDRLLHSGVDWTKLLRRRKPGDVGHER